MARRGLRPRFELEVPLEVERARERIRAQLTRSGGTVVGRLFRRHVFLAPPPAARRTWSPQLTLTLDARPATGSTLVCGDFAPQPGVWTFVMFLHALAAMSVLGGGVYGLAQWTLGRPPWALLAVPACWTRAWRRGSAHDRFLWIWFAVQLAIMTASSTAASMRSSAPRT